MGGRALLQDLIQGMAKRADISEQEAEMFVRTVFSVITDSLGDEKIVKIRNLGTFKLVEVGDRETVDANTGETIRVKGYRKIVFTPDNTLKDLINKPFAQFETVVLNDATNIADMEKGTETLPGEEDDLEDSTDDRAEEDSDNLDAEEEAAENETEDITDDAADDSVLNTAADESFSEADVAASEIPDNAEKKGSAEEAPQKEGEKEQKVQDTEAGMNNDEENILEADAPVTDVPEAGVPEMETSEAEEETLQTASIEYQHADYQKVQDQKVDELNVTTQNVEHQTIEHQSIVHQSQAENERSGGCLKLTQGGMIALFVFILCLMVGSYMAGYYRILCPCSLCPEMDETSVLPSEDAAQDSSAVSVSGVKQSAKKTEADTVRSSADHARKEDAISETKDLSKGQNTAANGQKADSLKQLKAKAARYPQVKNGAYLIVGVKSVHKLKSGENLLKLAQKVYGSRDFINYIIVMNGIKNPDLVQIGSEIKLPELVKGNDKL